MDGYGGPLYIGTGCFHRRDTLCGRQFSREIHNEFKIDIPKDREREETIAVLEEKSKVLASCTYENNTAWGKEVYIYILTLLHTNSHESVDLHSAYSHLIACSISDGVEIWLSS